MDRHIIGSLWDRSNRNGANKNFEYLFEGRKKIDELNYRADSILNEAQKTNDMNEDVQEQINRLILSDGESDAEVIQARGDAPLLKDRLDKTDTQLKKKADRDEVRLKSVKNELEDMSPTVLSAIEGGEGTSFNLLSIPQDRSVNLDKMSLSLENDFLDLKNSKIPYFRTLKELQSSMPYGHPNPAWVISEKSWFYWDGSLELPTGITAYFINEDITKSTSSTLNWKGNEFSVKRPTLLKAVGTYDQAGEWEIWETINREFVNVLASGVFQTPLSDQYNTTPLDEPIELQQDKTYALVVKYTGGGSKFIQNATPDKILNDNHVIMTGYQYNAVSNPVGKTLTEVATAYDHLINYDAI